MVKFAHIVNPLIVRNPDSDLHYAQPLTLRSMVDAQQFAKQSKRVDVDLFATTFAADHEAVPERFSHTEHLQRSILDLVPDADPPRQLPFLADILQRLYNNSPDADYLIYSNIDIGLWPNFYVAVADLLEEGYDAMVIARRTLSTEYTRVDQLPAILQQEGKPHFGFSCFVFPRNHFPKYLLGDTCIGLQPVGVTLAMNMIQHASMYQYFGQERLTFHLGDDRAWHDTILDAQHVHNEQILDWLVDQLLQVGPLPERGESLITNYQKWRCNYVIARTPPSLRRDVFRGLRKLGRYGWVASHYADYG